VFRDGGQSYVYLRVGDFPDFRQVPFGAAAYFGEDRGSFSTAVPIGDRSSKPDALAVADLNLDGAVDVIVGHVEAPPTVYFNDGSGRRFTPVMFGDAKGTADGFAVGDLDTDGRPDIAVARSEAPNVVYFADPPLRRVRRQ